ncbi:FtsQ-type POTRA domain-containing protein [Devosia rhodophyticola]|uniref:Cell division protein FtsQ n=1 Tax=Devosia rhodophyticola TaxID=3026423 RepID=A0ABY7YVE7_9HYPH|nr:cell division protein FtsQ/DivIB [Devosia rhodophyticola]WDR05333.1 FtsQ-type POTRA domain-containing protein [Devosia rhodophyticola]
MLASAQILDPRALPVPQQRGPNRRRLLSLGRVWVLHRLVLTRVIAAIVVCILIAGIYQVRSHVAGALVMLGEIAQGEFADAGFGVSAISITGQTLTGEQSIFDALGIEPRTSTLDFDAEAARQRIAKLASVASVEVRKHYPGNVTVTIQEKTPVARWRVDGVTFVVDASGEQIGEDRGAYGDLPLVIGDGAADTALVMIRALDQYPTLSQGIVALSRIADRRWDLIYETGLRVQLPEKGVAQALRNLDEYQADYQLLDRDVSIIDLRVPDSVAVRPAVHDEENKKS